MKIAVLGTGHYGLAIAYALSKKTENNIILWSHSIKHVEEFKTTKKLASIVNFNLPKNINVTNDLKESLNQAEIIYIVTSSKYFLSLINEIKPFYNKKTPICIATKGIEENSKELLSNITQNILRTNSVAVISGPSFAIDIINNEPVALALGTRSRKVAFIIKKTLSNDKIKLRFTTDIIGVQLCGAIKNIVAIGAGIIKGLGYSESTLTFLITESLHDIKNAMNYIGGKKKTILSFSGIGDLILTCTSTKSRNFSFGVIIGKYKNSQKNKEYLENNTVEGYLTLNTIYNLLKEKRVDMPIINILYDIIYNDNRPEKLLEFLIEKE